MLCSESNRFIFITKIYLQLRDWPRDIIVQSSLTRGYTSVLFICTCRITPNSSWSKLNHILY
jgi:hypothetical protein